MKRIMALFLVGLVLFASGCVEEKTGLTKGDIRKGFAFRALIDGTKNVSFIHGNVTVHANDGALSMPVEVYVNNTNAFIKSK